MVVKPLGSHTRGRCRCEIPPSPSPARPLLLEREIEIVDEARWGLSERDNGAGFLGMKELLGGLPSPASNIAFAEGGRHGSMWPAETEVREDGFVPGEQKARKKRGGDHREKTKENFPGQGPADLDGGRHSLPLHLRARCLPRQHRTIHTRAPAMLLGGRPQHATPASIEASRRTNPPAAIGPPGSWSSGLS
jgi:hypothetical protein